MDPNKESAAKSVRTAVFKELISYGVPISSLVDLVDDVKINPLKRIFSPKTKKKYHSEVFGVQLADLPDVYVENIGRVPKILHKMLRNLESSLKTEGLFRRSGNAARQNLLKASISSTGKIPDCDPVDLACVVKHFFRDLPEPLITNKVRKVQLLCCDSIAKPKLLAAALTTSCLLLPPAHLSTLKLLARFLSWVNDHSKSNLMSSGNISVCFAPSVFFSDKSISSKKGTTATSFHANKERVELDVMILETLLQNWTEIGSVAALRKPPDAAAVNEVSSHVIVTGFGSSISPIKDVKLCKRKFEEADLETLQNSRYKEKSVCFDIETPANVTTSANSPSPPKKLKVEKSEAANTTLSTRRRFLKFFKGSKDTNKSVGPLSSTVPNYSIEMTIAGETTVGNGSKKSIRGFLGLFKKNKKRNKVPIDCSMNATYRPLFANENVRPDGNRSAFFPSTSNDSNYLFRRGNEISSRDAQPGNRSTVSACYGEDGCHRRSRKNLGQTPRRGFFSRAGPGSSNRIRSSNGQFNDTTADRLLRSQEEYWNQVACANRKHLLGEVDESELDRTIFEESLERSHVGNLDDAILNEEDYDDDELDRDADDVPANDISLDPYEISNLSTALITGKYCGQRRSSRQSCPSQKKTEGLKHAGNNQTLLSRKESVSDSQIPRVPVETTSEEPKKTSMQSLDSGVVSSGDLDKEPEEESSPVVQIVQVPHNPESSKSLQLLRSLTPVKPESMHHPKSELRSGGHESAKTPARSNVAVSKLNKHLKSPLAVSIKSRRTLTFNRVEPFPVDF